MNRITAVVLSLIIGLSACACADKESKKQETSIKAGSAYEMSLPPTQLFRNKQSISYSNGFIYMHISADDKTIYEYDTVSKTCSEIKIDSPENTAHQNVICHDGLIYSIEHTVSDTDASGPYYLISIDYNTGKTNRLYTSNDKVISLASFYKDTDMLYFIEGKNGLDNAVDDGYYSGWDLMKLDITSGKAEKVVTANSYYIENDIIYFTKYSPEKHTIDLFCCPVTSPSEITDLGITVNTAQEIVNDNNETISFDFPEYMYYTDDDKIYYADPSNTLMCYDTNSKNTKPIATLSENSRINFFGLYNDKWYILSREIAGSGGQYCLYKIEKDDKPELILSDKMLNQKYQYEYEYIDAIAVFDDMFYVVTYNGDMGRSFYQLENDDSTELIKQLGNWDYDAYEEEMTYIEKSILNNDPSKEHLRQGH